MYHLDMLGITPAHILPSQQCNLPNCTESSNAEPDVHTVGLALFRIASIR